MTIGEVWRRPSSPDHYAVIPAEAGIQPTLGYDREYVQSASRMRELPVFWEPRLLFPYTDWLHRIQSYRNTDWIPAFAGMTTERHDRVAGAGLSAAREALEYLHIGQNQPRPKTKQVPR